MSNELPHLQGDQWDRWRRSLGFLLTPVAFLLVFYFADGLTSEGRRLAAILAAVVVLWISEAIPLPAAALLGAVLSVVLGVADAKSVFAHFADPIIFVFLGGFMLARAMMIHGLDRRIALGFLAIRGVGRHPATIMAGLGIVTAFLSMWVSNSATTAMMLPIAIGIVAAVQEVRFARSAAPTGESLSRWPYAAGMMLMVAYGASIGGIGTPVGSPPNLIGIGLIRESTGVSITFFGWMALAVPLLLAMGVVLFVLLYWLHPATEQNPNAERTGASSSDTDFASHLQQYIRGERAKLGPWTWGQINTLIAFSVAVTFWLLPGIMQLPWLEKHWISAWTAKHLPESIVAIGAAVLLFLLPINLRRGRFTLTWRDAERIDWGTILLFGGGLALGHLMFRTGVAHALGEGLTGRLGIHSLWVLTGFSIAIAIVISEAASNTASASMIVPVVIAIAQAAEVNPLPPALGACLGASFGFMLPVSTPPNAIVYGSGMVPLPSMVRAGIVFDIVGFFIIWGGLRLLCPLLGMA